MSDDIDEEPLPITAIKAWLSQKNNEWIIDADGKEKIFKAQLEEESAFNADNLFGDDDEEDELIQRVQRWSSSSINPDGIGGTFRDTCDDEEEANCVKIVYIISDSWQGFGNVVWASSRHVANMLANKYQCSHLLSPWLKHREISELHPLLGASFVEVGAGAGIPSWTAMRCGARVICSDQANPDRIRCIAEGMERNWREMNSSNTEERILNNAKKSRAVPHNWGSPIEELTTTLDKNEEGRFDIVVAADCVYMTSLHSELLQSIDNLLSKEGVALISFGLHGNDPDEKIWRIKDLAIEVGFNVEILEQKQLTPSTKEMESKQALINTMRLTR